MDVLNTNPYGSMTDTSYKSMLTAQEMAARLEGSSFFESVEEILNLNNPCLIQKNSFNPFIIRGSHVNIYQPRKTQLENKKEEIIAVLEVSEQEAADFHSKLQTSTAKLKAKLLTDIAPQGIALNIALTETLESLQLLMPNAEATVNFKQMERIYKNAMLLKFVNLVVEHLGVQEYQQQLLDETFGTKGQDNGKNVPKL